MPRREPISALVGGVGTAAARGYLRTIAAASRELATLTDDELLARCAAMLRTPKVTASAPDRWAGLGDLLGRELEKPDLTAMALAAELFSRFPPAGLDPGAGLYAEQLAAVVHLVRGSLVQMDTGEGKTFALMVAALVLLRTREKVYVVTANPYLATRDADTTSSFWSALGVPVGLALPEGYPDHSWPGWEAAVVYTTAEVLMFRRLEDDLESDAGKRRLRTAAAVLLDEADAILLEKVGSDFRLTRGVSPAFKDWREPLAIAAELTSDHVERLPDSLSVVLTAAGEQEVARLSGRPAGSGDRLGRLNDVELAYTALRVAVDGHDYKVRDGVVHPVDSATGWTDSYKTPSWLAPLEQHLGVQRRQIRTLTHILDGTSCLRGFAHLAGASGTLVEESLEYILQLNVSTVAIPPRRRRQEEKIPDTVFDTRERAENAIVRLVTGESPRRPVLVVTASTADAQRLAQRLERAVEPGVEVRYAAAETIAGERLFEAAGRPGVVIVSTRVAGRGVDIQLTAEARANDGALLVAMGHAEEARIDRQTLGRVGRGGDPYSAHFVNYFDDPYLSRLSLGALRPLVASMGDEGLGNNKLVAAAIVRDQRTRRRFRLQRFATATTCSVVDGEAYAFLARWRALLQADGDADHCGPAFVQEVAAAAANLLIPEDDGRVTEQAADTIVGRIRDLGLHHVDDRQLLTRLIGAPRASAVATTTDALREGLSLSVAGNEVANARRASDSPEHHVQQMIDDLVGRRTGRVLGRRSPTEPVGPDDLAELVRALADCCPLPTTWEALAGPAGSEREVTGEGLRAAVLAEVRRAYARREARVSALLSDPDGMRRLEREVLQDAVTGARRAAAPLRDSWFFAEDGGVRTFWRHRIEERTVAHLFSVRLKGEAAASNGEVDDAAVAAVLQRRSYGPVDLDSHIGVLARFNAPRPTRRIADETMSNLTDAYVSAAERRIYIERQKKQSALRYQYAYGALRRNLRTEYETHLVFALLANLAAADRPETLDDLFAARDHARYKAPPKLEVRWLIPPPPVVPVAPAPVEPVTPEELVAHFVDGLGELRPRHQMSRELLFPALNLILAAAPLPTLTAAENVTRAIESWMRSGLRAELGLPRRRRVDRQVGEFLDYLADSGLAARRPRGARAAGYAFVRRLSGRLANIRLLVAAAAGLGALVVAGVLATLVPTGTRTDWPLPLSIVERSISGGLVQAGSALGPGLFAITAAAVAAWVLRPGSDLRGAFPFERLLFGAALLGSALLVIPSASGGGFGWGSLGALAMLLLGGFVLRNLVWTLENTGQIRVVAGLLSASMTTTALVHLTELTGSRTPAVLFGATLLLALCTRRARRAVLAVQTVLSRQDRSGDDLVPSRRPVTARLSWQVFPFALFAAWLVDSSLRQLGGPYPVAVVIATLTYGAVLLAWGLRLSASATDEELWRRRLRSARQSMRSDRGQPVGLGPALTGIRRRLRLAELAVWSIVLVAAGAVSLALPPQVVPAPYGLVAVTLAAVTAELVTVFAASAAVVLMPSGGIFAEPARDGLVGDLSSDVHDVMRRWAKRFGVVLVLYLALKQVADVLGVWQVLKTIGRWISGP